MRQNLSAVRLTLFLSALLLALPLAAQQSEPADDNPNIYPRMAARLVELGVPVLDVRSEEEVAETGMVEGATRISHDRLDEIERFLDEEFGDDDNAAVVLYCGSGRRASRVIEAMRERGYGGLVNAGGYEDLVQALDSAGDEG
ncbi:rhodanese-like domain-containing protein [Halomonas denitrificans]|nr:rhodanese-like domain-containing protein [Halomonas denitrificans]